jgi:xanthine dehydrogenase YagR molybdenum-binding subunit
MTKRLTRVELDGAFSEVLVEVPENEPSAWPSETVLAVLGKPLARLEGPDKATGRARFTQDVNLPHMLWMKILRSPHPHARVRRIDGGRAAAHPGVKLVLTPDDAPPIPWYDGLSRLLDTTLRSVGDEVAAVVAVDEAAAREAIDLIEVEYEILPHVLDPGTALGGGAPAIHESGNLLGGQPATYRRGDVERGLAEADFVVEETFRSQHQLHACLETHCSVALWQGRQLTVWDSTQAVHPNRQALAEAFDIPLADVRVISLYSGGGFGSKLWLDKHTILAAEGARRLGRPVKVTLDREEEAHAMGNRPGNVMTIRAGCRRDGTLTALRLDSTGACGAYPAGAGAGTPLREIYRCPNVATSESAVHINADTARPHRAPGHVQGTWALEQVIDALAARCGIDPLDFRLRNYSEVNQVENKPYSTKGLLEAYEQGAARFGWREREARRGRRDGPSRRGFGMATQIWGGGGGPPGYAIVKLYHDGSAVVFSGCQDIGTGTRTAMAQVACEEIGLTTDRVACVMGDTQGTPYGFVSGGSRTTPSQGPAVRMAAAEVKRRLLDLAAGQMGLPAGRLDSREGYVFDRESPSRRKAIEEIVGALKHDFGTGDVEANMLIGVGWRGPNRDDVSVNSWGAQFAEVEVDTDTGEVRVVRVTAAHEIGRVVNPLAASSQVEGGVIQGLGFALCEERVVDRAGGRVLNADLHDYRIPLAPDVPAIDTILIDRPDPAANSVGVKGLGEPPIIPTAAAVANAIHDAIGVRLRIAPMTPRRVLEALLEGGRHA